MAFHHVGLHAIRLEARGNVITPQPARVEPVFQRRAPAAVPEHAAIPDALERRDLVVACAAPAPAPLGLPKMRDLSRHSAGSRQARKPTPTLWSKDDNVALAPR